MSYRKSAISLTVALTSVMFTAACGSTNGGAGSGGSGGQAAAPAANTPAAAAAPAPAADSAKASGQPTELVLFGAGIDGDKLAKYWKSFEDDNHVKIKAETTTADKFMASFMAAHNAKQPTDILMLNGQDVRFMATAGMIQDISQQAAPYKDRFVPAALTPYTFGGKIYAIPSGSMTTTTMYYNKKIFADNGLKPPTNLQELADVSAALKKKGISNIATMGKDIYRWPMWYFETFAQTSGNKSVERTMDTLRGKAKFTDPDYVAAMKALQQISKSGAFIPGVNGVDITAAKAIFSSGKSAMFFGGSWEASALEAGKQDVGIVRFPLVTGQGGTIAQATGGSGAAMAVSSTIDPKNQSLALKFLDYWTSDKLQQQMLDDNNGVLAVNINVKSKSTDPIFQDLTQNYLKDTVTFLDWYWPPEVTKAFQENIQAVVGGQKEPEAAMQSIQKTFDDLVAKGYNFDKTQQ